MLLTRGYASAEDEPLTQPQHITIITLKKKTVLFSFLFLFGQADVSFYIGRRGRGPIAYFFVEQDSHGSSSVGRRGRGPIASMFVHQDSHGSSIVGRRGRGPVAIATVHRRPQSRLRLVSGCLRDAVKKVATKVKYAVIIL